MLLANPYEVSRVQQTIYQSCRRLKRPTMQLGLSNCAFIIGAVHCNFAAVLTTVVISIIEFPIFFFFFFYTTKVLSQAID